MIALESIQGIDRKTALDFAMGCRYVLGIGRCNRGKTDIEINAIETCDDLDVENQLGFALIYAIFESPYLWDDAEAIVNGWIRERFGKDTPCCP